MEASQDYQTHKDKVVRMAKIHDTAVIHPEAKIGRNVEIGPYTTIGENVEIKENTVIGPHVVIDGWTTIGKNNEIYHGATIGIAPQVKDFDGEKSEVVIGDNNTIRENVDIHRGTNSGGGETRIGNNNFIMAYCHIANDCQLGDNIIMTNASHLSGQVKVDDKAVIAGLTEIEKGVRIGTIAMVGAHSRVINDVPPYILVDGHPAQVKNINVIGLRRNGFKPALRKQLKCIYKILYRSDLNIKAAIKKMEQEIDYSCEELEHFLEFLRTVEGGICR